MSRKIGPRHTPNPHIPRDGAWFHGAYGAYGQLYSYARGDWRALVHVDWDGAVLWTVCRKMEPAEWLLANEAESAQRQALDVLSVWTVVLARDVEVG